MQSEYSEKVVTITGAASGFGRLLAERLSAQGAKLVISDINERGVQDVANNLGENVRAMRCDVTNESDVVAFCAVAEAEFGGIDIAINNAGATSPMKSLLETTEDEFDRNYQINARSVFLCMKHQIPMMQNKGGGAILNVASVAGLNAAPKLAAYGAAKHAVVGLTKTAAVEFARKNIRVNAVCPFYSPTPLVSESNLAERVDLLESGAPMKRLGTPDEMVSAMLAILLPSNSYLTGQAIAIDGGVTAI